MGTGRARGVSSGKRWGRRKEMEGILLALRAGAAGWRVSAAFLPRRGKVVGPAWGVGAGFQGGAGGGQIGQNTRWNVRREEVEVSDRGFKASGCILRNHSLAGDIGAVVFSGEGTRGAVLFSSMEETCSRGDLTAREAQAQASASRTHPPPDPPKHRIQTRLRPFPVLASACSSHSQGLGG